MFPPKLAEMTNVYTEAIATKMTFKKQIWEIKCSLVIFPHLIKFTLKLLGCICDSWLIFIFSILFTIKYFTRARFTSHYTKLVLCAKLKYLPSCTSPVEAFDSYRPKRSYSSLIEHAVGLSKNVIAG